MGKGSSVLIKSGILHEIIKFGVEFEKKKYEQAKADRIERFKRKILARKPWFRPPATEEQAAAQALEKYNNPGEEYFMGWSENWEFNGRIGTLDAIVNLVDLAGKEGYVTLGSADASWIQYYKTEMDKANAPT